MKKKIPLTEDERQIIRQFCELLKMIKTFFYDDIKGFLSPNNKKAKEIIRLLPPWGGFYELPEEQFFQMFGQMQVQIGLAITPIDLDAPPLQVISEAKRRLKDGLDEESRARIREIEEEKRPQTLPFFFAMLGQLKCLSMFGMSMHHLLELAKDSDEALFRAVLVDSAVIETSVTAQRIKLAEAMRESNFLEELALSLSKSKAHRHKRLDDMRAIMAFVENNIGLDTLTDDDLVIVFQRDLGLIGEKNGDSLDAIKWQIRKWKRSQEGKF